MASSLISTHTHRSALNYYTLVSFAGSFSVDYCHENMNISPAHLAMVDFTIHYSSWCDSKIWRPFTFTNPIKEVKGCILILKYSAEMEGIDESEVVQMRPALLRVRLDTLTSIISEIDMSDEEEENGIGPLDPPVLMVRLWITHCDIEINL